MRVVVAVVCVVIVNVVYTDVIVVATLTMLICCPILHMHLFMSSVSV